MSGQRPSEPVSALSAATTPLSAREVDIMRLRADGLTVDAVAADLGLSPSTVRDLGARAYRKLGVDNIASAFRALGWLRLP